ncbi:solute carrier family 4 (anion exchanger), member 2 [Fistulifera solaris]|uniref:Solute carrier family 4 (Anion exchanger), member 2 n=1 Tax=Fistulifera solaris TaxID=1519565 RepID=A0A1Z5KMH9_FISSO|nr:solute carrier family 4 (anion exchanger), member 2 [Fistulifera solaris]|eukprot:GAX27540.1 solute carrier family 4 (anion exchanger), member 2 [Fistulifera solaris]
MPPKSNDIEAGQAIKRLPSNAELVPHAGKITMDEPAYFGKGILKDFKTTVGTHWREEMTNFNQKTVAVSMLMFITVIAPTLAFGASYSTATESHIGAIETILATAWIGCAYSFIGGMPLCIIGSTGPVLAFTTVLYDMSKNMDIPFYTFYAWVSVWMLIYAFLCSFFDLTRFVRLATRFTDDIFAFLIVSIFVIKAIGDPFGGVDGILFPFDPNHKTHQNQDADYDFLQVALLGVILGFGTTWLIFYLRSFKNSSFFCNDTMRSSIHDFSVTFSVLIWTIVSKVIFKDVEVASLKVPDQFEPTFQCCDDACTLAFPRDCPDQAERAGVRSWFADMADTNGKGWVPIAAAGPAVLAFFLLYLDNGITWHLIMHKSNNVQHGEAYNYDLLLSGCFNFVNGLLGLPWLVATTVPCIVHLNSLSEKDKDGNVLYVQETRLTMLFSHMCVGFSILALDLLKLLPLPVLNGVFLFMGVSALPGIQFWNRFLLFFQQPSKYPETPYTKYMDKGRIHLFTIIEMFFFAMVFVVQNIKAVAVVFPMMTFFCIPARTHLLPRFFEGWELVLLDGDIFEIQEWIDKKADSVAEYEASLRGDLSEYEDDATQ